MAANGAKSGATHLPGFAGPIAPATMGQVAVGVGADVVAHGDPRLTVEGADSGATDFSCGARVAALSTVAQIGLGVHTRAVAVCRGWAAQSAAGIDVHDLCIGMRMGSGAGVSGRVVTAAAA